MKRAVLTVLAYVAATFAVQATSHFAVNAAHYASLAYLRPEPIVALGLASMLVQGSALAWLYPRLAGAGRSIGHAVAFAWLAGSLIVSYIALAEPGKYAVPAIGPWVAVEVAAGFLQFTLFGLLLGTIHRRRAAGTGHPRIRARFVTKGDMP